MSICPLIGFSSSNVFKNVAIWGEACVMCVGEGMPLWVGGGGGTSQGRKRRIKRRLREDSYPPRGNLTLGLLYFS